MTSIRRALRASKPGKASVLFLFIGAVLVASNSDANPPGNQESIAWHEMDMASPAAIGMLLPDHAVADSALRARPDPTLFQSNRLLVNLPGNKQLHAIRRASAKSPNGAMSMTGDFTGAPGGFFALTEHKGLVTGFLQTAFELWEVRPLTDGDILVYRVDPAALPPEATPLQIPLENPVNRSAGAVSGDSFIQPLITGDVAETTASDLPYQHDLLVVYTPRAAATAGGQASIEGAITNAVAAANAGYAHSGIAINLNLVGMAETAYAETGDFFTSLARLSGTQDGYMDEIHTLRDHLKADVVVLASEDSSYCGLAYMMSSASTAFAPSAFGVVRPLCFSNHTLAHEIGHIQGNDHDRLNGIGGSFPFSFGYRTCDGIAPSNGQSFRTIMSYSCGSVPRINYFSSPLVMLNGAPMGVNYETDPAQAADNARSMNSTAAAVASFRTDAPVLYPPAPPSPASVVPAAVTAVQWTNVADEAGYDVIRETWNSRKRVWSASTTRVAANTTSLSVGLASGTYRFKIRAFNSAGTSNNAIAGCATCGSDGSFSVTVSKNRK
ncbi:MAG: M12 family metallo-peptidase [Pseudomonadales bacterium]